MPKKKGNAWKVKKNKERMRQSRSCQQQRSTERERDTAAHRAAREGSEFRTGERERDASAHRASRASSEFRTPEKERDAAAHRSARMSSEFRSPEKERDAAAHRAAREDPKRRKLEFTRIAEQQKNRAKCLSMEQLYAQFNKEIRDHPNHVCRCCGRLLYKNQCVAVLLQDLHEKGLTDEFLKSVIYITIPAIQERVTLCKSCKNNIYDGKVPRLALSNGLDFPAVPPELKGLSPLEERLVALRNPFMQIRPMGFERQSQLRGNVVNVESDMSVIAKIIPRRFDDTSVVQVKLMRRMCYSKPYMYETVRPYKVHRAATHLLNTELYSELNVQLSDEFSQSVEGDSADFICTADIDSADNEEDLTACWPKSDNAHNDTPGDDVTGADETLVHNHTDYGIISCYRIAPSEGKIPLSLFTDLHAEEMSFPTIYCGRKRTLITINRKGQRKLSYTDIAKSEIMRYDRRACAPTKVLYSFKKSFNQKVTQCVSTFLRKKRGNQGKYKACQVRNPEFMKSILENDEGYSVFKNLRSSPSYWAAKCKKVIAMVRQLGKCTFFITLSAAETKWNELLVLLMKLLKNRDISEEEAGQLSNDEKNELVRSDPVSCMRNFDRRYRALFKFLLKPKNGVFSPHELCDYFHRLEFQMRGSPHSHGLYWLNNAPEFIAGNEESEKECISFIDKYVTCARNGNGEADNYVKYQCHKHSHTCRKGLQNRMGCRFNFPRPPLPRTMILYPLPHTMKNKKKWTSLFAQIRLNLNERGRNPAENISFEDFLSFLKFSEKDYIMAIRSSINRPTVFNKRKVDEAFINPYNPTLLSAWKANMDIQFVLDTYACAKYCVGYILKSDGGMSRLLKEINRSAARGNTQICSKLERFAKVLWNGTEISAQEAAGFLLGISNVKCSRSDVYIDTSPPEERTHILKSKEQLESLKDDDEHIYQAGLLDH